MARRLEAPTKTDKDDCERRAAHRSSVAAIVHGISMRLGCIAALATVFTVLGCSGEAETESPIDAASEPSFEDGMVLGPDGGVVTNSAGALVRVPAGALLQPTLLRVQLVSSGYPELLPNI